MSKFVKSILALGITSALSVMSVQAATYKVIDKGAAEKLKYTYAQQENTSNQMAVSGTNVYNFPVQYQYLDTDDFKDIELLAEIQHENVHELVDLEDYDAMVAGNPTANDLAWIKRFLQGRGSSSLYQKVGDTIAMTNVNGTTEEFIVFDEPFEGTSDLTRSTVDIISGFTDSGLAYGTATAPYLALPPFTESDGDVVTHWVRAFGQRGFFSYDNGAQVYAVEPIETKYGGGISAVIDVNENGVAVGYSSFKLNINRVETIEDTTGGCADPDVLDDLPKDVCIQNLQNDMYHIMATQWTLDANGNAVTKELGLLVTPHEDDDRTHSSYALAVNNNGVAVGYADGWDDETETEPSSGQRSNYYYAVVYKNGEVIDFNGDHAHSVNSKAYDINDKGIAVGHVYKVINGRLVKKFFYVDTTVPAEEMTMVIPKDFFPGSASGARAINENGFIVGEGEIETHNNTGSNPRRTAAFLYDIEKETYTDINTFLSCDSGYTIREARDINDNNVISATAIVKVDRRDAKGELMKDADGKQLVEDVVRAVTLAPIDGGEIEDCSVVEEKTERKGAGLGFISLFLLGGLVSLRRKWFK